MASRMLLAFGEKTLYLRILMKYFHHMLFLDFKFEVQLLSPHDDLWNKDLKEHSSNQGDEEEMSYLCKNW